MKKLVSVFLLCAMILLCSCSPASNPESQPTDTQAPETTAPAQVQNGPIWDGKNLKILAITSSFGLNTTELLYDIAKAEGAEEVIVGRLYISGGTLGGHINNALSKEPAYQYFKYSDKERKTTKEVPLLQGLLDEQWDVIFLQQSAAQAGQEVSYNGLVMPLVNYVKQNMPNPDAKLVWNMTWAYQADSKQAVFLERFNADQMYMYNEIVNVTKKIIVPLTAFSAIIPTGTAIQNARTSYFGDTLTKDTYHLNNLGRVIAGYTLYSILTDKPITEVNLSQASSYDLKTPVVLSDNDKKVIIESVNAAIENPFTVTQSTYTAG